MSPIAGLTRFFAAASNALYLAAALAFAAFVSVKGVPTLRHDWAWPIDRTAIPSFVSESVNGWVSAGFGTANAHPTTYLVALPVGAATWLFGPLAALAMLCATIGYAGMRCVAAAAAHWGAQAPAALGIGFFALFNPWVYNEVVAGHLIMVLAYVGLIGCFAEMLRGKDASAVRLALWLALIEAQLQFFIVALLALAAFAIATKKWLPPLIGIAVALPSIVGLVADRSTLLRIPYTVEWQVNQSVLPVPLLGLGGYFPGYADRLGPAASIAVGVVFALAILGAVAMRRSRPAIAALVAAILVYVAILGVHGPLAAPYAWMVRNVPESGVFRELYDLAGVLAALAVILACAAAARVRALAYVAFAAGIALPIAWLVRPPSDLWVGARAYPHPSVSAPPFSRIALLPAFQPVGLRDGRGDGADPDVHLYPARVVPLNEYFPTYPADLALAYYEQSGKTDLLRALGVTQIVVRPWLVSKSRGGIGWAARSLAPPPWRAAAVRRNVDGAAPLMSECDEPRTVSFDRTFGACDIFFGDAVGYAAVSPIVAPAESVDPRTDWIDARLAFAEAPDLANPFGGALTQSRRAYPVNAGSWLLAYVRGELLAAGAAPLVRSGGAFTWVRVPLGVGAVRCAGLCELVVQTPQAPAFTVPPPPHARPLDFRRVAPWLYVVDRPTDAARLLRFNERYDGGWTALAGGHPLPHVRLDAAVNGWLLTPSSHPIVLLHVTAMLQFLAEIFGIVCTVAMLEALTDEPTKRAR